MNIGFDNNPVEEYIIDIITKNNVVRDRYAINDKDIYKRVLMSDHHVKIGFSLDVCASFSRGDYLMWEGVKFALRQKSKPTRDTTTGGFVYDLQFDAPEIFFKDIMFYYMNQALKESQWSLTSNAATFFQLIADSANRYFNTTLYHVGIIEFDEIKYLSFQDVTVWDGCTQVAEAYEGEWYLDGYSLNLVKKYSYGSEVDLEEDVSVGTISTSNGESETQYTRILALGSTRNIPADYRETEGEEAVDAIYQKRLRIPADKGGVIDAYPDMLPEEVVEGTVVFEDVYPKRIGTMSDITTVEYTDTNEDTGEVTKWNAYRYKDTGLSFKAEYILPGIELRLIGQSGDINGLDFAVKFNPESFPETDARSQVFEIVRNEDYGKPLPNDILRPQNGDTYVLYGFNIDLVSDQYVPAGEEELYETAVEWQQEQLKDKSVFDCPAMMEYFEENEFDFGIGQKVKLIRPQFEEGFRLSRIQGFEKHLINNYQATYTVGDNFSYSWVNKVEDSIKELQIAGVTYQGIYKNGAYIIKTFDNTPPSESNTYSAKASDFRFFNRQTGGTVLGDALFKKNVTVEGNVTANQIGNSTFNAGQFGSGFRFWLMNGISYGQVDYLTVTREMLIHILTIAETKSIGGQLVISAANMKATAVVDGGTYWKVSFDSDNGNIPNQFAVDDQALFRRFNGVNAKYYWARVTSIGADYINLSKTDKDGSGIPAVGDEIVQFGNRTNTARQFAIVFSSVFPALGYRQYWGINSYDLTGKEVTRFADPETGNRITGEFILQATGENVATKFSVLSNEIALKVSQTDFDILGNTVSTVQAQQIIQAGQIASNVVQIGTAQTEAENAALIAKAISTGKMLYKDPSFINGVNGIYPYNLKSGSDLTLTRISAIAGSPSTSGYCIEIKVTGTETSPNKGGFSFNNQTRTNAIFLTKIVANIPVGYSLGFHSNNLGTGSSYKWLGSNVGTGTWTEYFMYVKCGNPAPSTTTNFFSIFGDGIPSVSNPLLWYLSYATVFDLTDAEVNYLDTINTVANSKNKTYYQDTTPTAPAGGFTEGDIWQKITPTDETGNISTDASKNVCKPEYRWNGTTWIPMNVNIQGSFVTQTAGNYNILVQKTGIDELGVGETLKGMIDVIPGEIEIAVGAMQIGLKNYIAKAYMLAWNNMAANTVIQGSDSDGNYMSVSVASLWTYVVGGSSQWKDIFSGKIAYKANTQYVFKVRWKLPASHSGRNLYFRFFYSDGSASELSLMGTQTTVTDQTLITPIGKTISKISASFGSGGGRAYIYDIQLTEGNKITEGYITSDDDIPEMVGSTINLKGNKIVFGSKTIELKGTTIAQAIEAEELNVNDKFIVSPNGDVRAEGDFTVYYDGVTPRRIAIVDRSSGTDRTKSLFHGGNIRTIESLSEGATTANVVTDGFADSKTVATQNEGQTSSYLFTGALFTIPSTGSSYDLIIPAIPLQGSALQTGYAAYRMYLLNTATNVETVIVARNTETDPYNMNFNQQVTINGVAPGNYRLKISLYAEGNSASISYTIASGVTFQILPIIEIMEIGANGFCSILNYAKWAHHTTAGFIMRSDNFGFKFSSDGGLKVSLNMQAATPTWKSVLLSS